MPYDPQGVRAYYDEYGTREWERLERNPQGRIKYAIHRYFLDRYTSTGERVLDLGCGPGRFSLDLARAGVRLTLADISQVQLDQARRHLEEAGLWEQVDAVHCLDMVDLGTVEDASFDRVVCFGAPLSYTRERYPDALREIARVIRRGGHLLVSVCSLYGVFHLAGPFDDASFFEAPDSHVDWRAVLSGEGIVFTRPGSNELHQPMVLFSSQGLRQALEQAGFDVQEMAAADPVISEGLETPRLAQSEAAMAALTELELALCRQPGMVDTDEHLLAVARKR